ncbi:MAG: zf-HC2 domain-containing protein [bacterium]
MRCKKVQRRLSAFLDGEIKSKGEKDIKGHLLDCPTCSKELEGLSASWDILLKLKPVEPPVYLIQKILTAATVSREYLSWWQELILKPAPIIATATAGILIGIFLGQTFYSKNGYLRQMDNEFTSSIYLDSFADFPEWSAGNIIFAEEEG